MPDLELQFAEWRRQMAAGGIKSPAVLDELESHLRDDVEERVCAGASARDAFESAVQRLGQAAVLESEFEKVGETKEAPERVKQAFFALAGIPNHYLNDPMNTSSSNLEPRWATYVKATAFLAPAVFLWALCSVFIVPKLQQICVASGLPDSTETFFWNLTHLNIQTTLFFREHGVLVAGAMIATLVLLEWRSEKWPRYRRVAVGFGTFLFNAVVLFSIFMMVVVALLVAPALMHHAK